jgi:hypothetical protein
MPANYVLLEKITVGAAGASSVTFSNIPQTGYTDLVVKTSVRTDRASTDDLLNVNFNGVSTNQSSRWMKGDGSSATSGTYGSNLYLLWVDAASDTANTFSSNEMYISNYNSSNFKSISIDGALENNATLATVTMVAGLWSSTAAITSIAITSVFSANFVQGSTFYLYGVAKLGTTPAIVPYATGGDTIMTDGTYWYHAFRSSGTFTPAKGLSCDVLVVAGGGGGGGGTNSSAKGAGGGAGGLRGLTAQSFASGTGYTVTIGAGGAGATGSSGASVAAAGSASSISSISAAGGGGGGDYWTANGRAGGSGGGGGTSSSIGTGGAGNTPSVSPVQGYAGGNASALAGSTTCAGGGGGGAAGVGGTAVTGVAGNGGAAETSYSTWASVTSTGVSGNYAGGGSGGGGTSVGTTTGGGGLGGLPDNVGSNGTANTGGGGGGGSAISADRTGGTGGSGIVIVRYAV